MSLSGLQGDLDRVVSPDKVLPCDKVLPADIVWLSNPLELACLCEKKIM
jgi:hypothetical protein